MKGFESTDYNMIMCLKWKVEKETYMTAVSFQVQAIRARLKFVKIKYRHEQARTSIQAGHYTEHQKNNLAKTYLCRGKVRASKTI